MVLGYIALIISPVYWKKNNFFPDLNCVEHMFLFKQNQSFGIFQAQWLWLTGDLKRAGNGLFEKTNVILNPKK